MSNDAISDERGSVLLRVAAAADLLGGLLDRCLAGSPLSAREFEILTVLSVRGPQSPSEIAAVTGVPAPSVSRVTGRLQRAGLVGQRQRPGDRRSRLVELTDAGRAAFLGAQAGFRDLYAQVADTLGAGLPVVASSVRRLEWALRLLAGAPVTDPPSDAGDAHALHYAGPALTPGDETEVLEYIEWIRSRARLRRP